ncbi:MAG: hypothetical protein AAGF77_09690 [Bacteroidota bacterium]
MKKYGLALLGFCGVLLVFTCTTSNEPDCNCPEGITTITFTEVDVEVFDDLENTNSTLNAYEDSISKATFLLNIDLQFTEFYEEQAIQRAAMGFDFSTALACSCFAPVTVQNRVEALQILQRAPGDTAFVSASEYFGVVRLLGEETGVYAIAEALADTRQAEDLQGFFATYNLKIIDEDAIPNEAVFQIKITLSDGTLLEAETETILFDRF